MNGRLSSPTSVQCRDMLCVEVGWQGKDGPTTRRHERKRRAEKMRPRHKKCAQVGAINWVVQSPPSVTGCPCGKRAVWQVQNSMSPWQQSLPER